MNDYQRQTGAESRLSEDPIGSALAEDLGMGDLTSKYFVGDGEGQARIFAKEPAVVAGLITGAEVFRRVDAGLNVWVVGGDGDRVEIGQTVLEISGLVRSILTAERVALNFIQRLSGTATMTRRFVEAVEGSGVRILDTRKTTPGLRRLEKAAVVAGGGVNHRMGLYDRVMVKDNHLMAGTTRKDLPRLIERFSAEHPGVIVELEADTLEQVAEFLTIRGVGIILLDNMSCEEMRKAVEMGAGRVEFEASGGVTLETVAEIAATGVDAISVGALTHSAVAIDFSLELLG